MRPLLFASLVTIGLLVSSFPATVAGPAETGVFCPHDTVAGPVSHDENLDCIGVIPATAVATHQDTTCFLFATGAVECTGNSKYASDWAGTDAVAVESGVSEVCVLFKSGNVECRGPNTWSSEGYVGGDAVKLSVGGIHKCVVTVSGTVSCWGGWTVPAKGAILDCNDAPDSRCKDIYAGTDAVDVSVASGMHACVLLRSGNVYCWGYNPDHQADDYLGGDAIAVAAADGDEYTCFLLSTGNVQCQGHEKSPAKLLNYAGGDAIGISASRTRGCILFESGNVKCHATWTASIVTDYEGGDAVSVANTFLHSCALLMTGEVKCVGIKNFDGTGSGYRYPPSIALPGL